jgi:hypothetical protein
VAFIVSLALKLYNLIGFINVLAPNDAVVNMHCDSEKTECYLKLWAKNLIGNGGHLNHRSFVEYTGYILLELKG